MIFSIPTLFLIVAFVLFLLATLNAPSGIFNFSAAGLACLTLALLLPHLA